MEKTQNKFIETIMNNYQEKETTKFDELKNLDKKVKKPALVLAYIFGTIGSLILGMGMCATMNKLPNVILNLFTTEMLMIVGIIVGLVGIVMTVSNYYIYKRILKNRKNKYSKEIISLSEELLNK